MLCCTCYFIEITSLYFGSLLFDLSVSFLPFFHTQSFFAYLKFFFKTSYISISLYVNYKASIFIRLRGEECATKNIHQYYCNSRDCNLLYIFGCCSMTIEYKVTVFLTASLYSHAMIHRAKLTWYFSLCLLSLSSWATLSNHE